MVRVGTFLDQWKTMREDVAQAVEQMPEGALDYRPADDFLTFRELATHIHDIGMGMTGMLLAGDTDFISPDWRERRQSHVRPIPEGAAASAIAAALRESFEATSAEVRKQDEAFLSGIVDKFDGTRITRMEMLLFLREHELTHRAQMFVYLRLNGVVPPTTRRRLERRKKQSA